MTIEEDQNFYEKKERLLHYVEAGTATQEQKAWLKRWGFMPKPPKPPIKPTNENPTQTEKVSRYRSRKATPINKVEGGGGPGTRINRYGNVVEDKSKKWTRTKKVVRRYYI